MSLILGGYNPLLWILSLSTFEVSRLEHIALPAYKLPATKQQFPLFVYRQNASQLLAEGTAHKFSSGDQGKLINYLTHVQFFDSAHSTAGDASTAEVPSTTERPDTAGGREQSASPKKSR